MNICILAATEMELQYLKEFHFKTIHSISFVVHGVGMINAMYYIQKACLAKPDMIIQCGIAGSFQDSLSIGETVIVRTECLGDIGAQDYENIIDLFDLGFTDKNSFPFSNGLLINENIPDSLSLKKVKGITVNMTAGNTHTIELRKSMYQPDIETMEGACLHYVCLQENITFLQFRGISNYIEPRNKDNWQIVEAIHNCQQEVIHYIQNLS